MSQLEPAAFCVRRHLLHWDQAWARTNNIPLTCEVFHKGPHFSMRSLMLGAYLLREIARARWARHDSHCTVDRLLNSSLPTPGFSEFRLDAKIDFLRP